jgi:hypothetical protein
MGVQVFGSAYPQVPEKTPVWRIAAAPGEVLVFCKLPGAEGKPDRRRARHGRSGAHNDPDPAKCAVPQVIGFIEDKSAIHLAQVYGEMERNFVGQHFWARGYFVSAVGRDENTLTEYIRKREAGDIRLDQINL